MGIQLPSETWAVPITVRCDVLVPDAIFLIAVAVLVLRNVVDPDTNLLENFGEQDQKLPPWILRSSLRQALRLFQVRIASLGLVCFCIEIRSFQSRCSWPPHWDHTYLHHQFRTMKCRNMNFTLIQVTESVRGRWANRGASSASAPRRHMQFPPAAPVKGKPRSRPFFMDKENGGWVAHGQPGAVYRTTSWEPRLFAGSLDPYLWPHNLWLSCADHWQKSVQGEAWPKMRPCRATSACNWICPSSLLNRETWFPSATRWPKIWAMYPSMKTSLFGGVVLFGKPEDQAFERCILLWRVVCLRRQVHSTRLLYYLLVWWELGECSLSTSGTTSNSGYQGHIAVKWSSLSEAHCGHQKRRALREILSSLCAINKSMDQFQAGEERARVSGQRFHCALLHHYR